MDPADDISARERAALARLYDRGEDDDAGAAAAADDVQATAASWQGVRDLVRQAREGGFDEEPPARIDALLLAAARQHAPAPKPGLLARLRQWMAASMLHPALTGAAALVVVAGTAGLLYLRGHDRVPEPTVAAPASGGSAAAAAASGSAAPTTESGLVAPALPLTPAGDPGAAAGSAAVVDELRALEDKVRREQAAAVVERPRDEVRRGGARPAGGDGAETTTRSDGEASGGTFEAGPAGAGGTKGAGADVSGGAPGDVVVGGVVTRMALENAPPPPPSNEGGQAQPRATGAGEVAIAADATTAEDDRDRGPSPRVQAENLLRQARTAAKKGDCATVKLMARRARQLDAGFYASTFVKDADVAKCL